jgi:hypothetical protein
MPLIEKPSFHSKFDIHALRGQPLQLHQLIFATWSTPTGTDSGTFHKYLHQPHQPKDVEIEFSPTFRVEPFGTKLIGAHVEIDNAAGTLTGLAPPQLGAPAHNFILEAKVVRNGPPGSSAPNFPTMRVRVHLHQSVEQIWLTPNRLTIRRPSGPMPRDPKPGFTTNCRFTVRAQFDDGTVGDISLSAKLTVAHGDTDWFDDALWVRIPETAVDGDAHPITIQTTPDWNSKSAQGDILVLKPWASESEIPPADLIDGNPGVRDGSLAPERFPNVLFIAAGFTGDDRSAFRQFTDTIVDQLTTKQRLKPYPYLADAINYWRLPFAATEAGVSVRCEVIPITHQQRLFAIPVPAPVHPPKTGTWEVSHLLYAAGLPIPSDQPGSISVAQLRQRWSGQLRTEWADKTLDPATVPSRVIEAWQKYATRTFIDEVDNFPSVAIGEQPSVEFDDWGELLLHPWRDGFHTPLRPSPKVVELFRRVTAAARNGVTVTLGSGAGIGNLWADDDPSFEFDNRSLVAIYANVPVGRAFVGRSQFLVLEQGPLLVRPSVRLSGDVQIPDLLELPGLAVERAVGRNALLLDIPQLSATEPRSETWDVFAHELSHAFGLGDEYGADPELPDQTIVAPNLMPSDDVLAHDHKTVVINKIRWNWQRVSKACVTTGTVQPIAQGLFAVPVPPNHGFRFSLHEPVLLRQRVKREFMPPAALISGECMVHSISNDGSTVTISRTSGTLDLSVFGAGSLLYAPVRAPPTVRPFRPYLTIVSPLAERIMAGSGTTLNGKPCDPADVAGKATGVQVPLLRPPTVAQSVPLHSLPRLVGVYFGGGNFACGVVHPAGTCKMRSPADSYSRFCHVCQYALVEQIDPNQHGRIDRDYDQEYTV